MDAIIDYQTPARTAKMSAGEQKEECLALIVVKIAVSVFVHQGKQHPNPIMYSSSVEDPMPV